MATQNPLIPQGVLNRVLTAVVIPSNTALNITAPYMAKGFAKLEFEGDWTGQVGTGTGIVNSPEPYIFARVTVNLLRTQALSASWVAQGAQSTVIGQVNVHSDTSTFPVASMLDTSIFSLDPGAFDGTDPVVRLVLRGSYPINAALWTA
ncbi:hypothetical protein [Paraburkholderia tropica]|uniref:hypothetical protein n=1 Tax=Paraburkholderia tropica TaxID=92647 RepID=UPI003D291111